MSAPFGERAGRGRANRRRERLVSPLGLSVAGTAFALAFAVLAPSRDAFTLGESGVVPGGAVAVDELRLAYLKARGVAEELGTDEALAALTALARDGRVEEARALLAASPALALDDVERLWLDVELAGGAARRAGGTVAGEAARARLAERLEQVIAAPAAHDIARLGRGAELASRTDDPDLAAAFHVRLAALEPTRAAEHLARCGRALASRAPRGEAIDCLSRARAASDDPRERFALGLELLAVLPGEAVDERRARLVDELLAHGGASIAELDALATALLAIERPGAAARVYARLAELDDGARGRRLEAAARWSEAAGYPAEAAVFLDRMTPAEVGDRAAHRRRIEALLIGAGRGRDALERAALRVAETPTDPDTVREAVAMAEAQGANDRALVWNATLLVARPDDAEALARQTTLALAVGRPDIAREAAERTHALDPDDIASLARLAQLAEWDGDAEAALRHRRRLRTLRGDDDDLIELARLAELVRRPALAADALAELARRVPPDRDAVRRLVRLHELDGRPDAAARALDEIMARHGSSAWALRELATLQRRHRREREALDAWTRLAARHGRSVEETLARVELLWHLGEEDRAAELARGLEDMTFGSEASSRQASVLAEIGWRYRLPTLDALARPLIASIDDADQRLMHARRAIDTLVDAGRVEEALREAETRWRADGQVELGLLALRLAIESGERVATERLLADTADVEPLRALPAYWSLRATVALRQGDADVARRAYETALGIDADDVEAIGGLLWLLIGENDTASVAASLARHESRAIDAPSLWSAFAVGHVTIDDPGGSLPWFERALGTSDVDYALLLTFADALEAAGRLDHARRVRRHVVAELRPRLLEGVARDRETVLRQYGSVLARHGGVDANEAWMRYVSGTEDRVGDALVGDARFWREDMAISWLMATERHEHARLIMARLHERRLTTPPWQDLALALRAGDADSVRAMLEAGGGLSAGNRILALREIGREADAWTLALRTLEAPPSEADRAVAAAQYADLARYRPRHASALARTVRDGALDVTETALALRHTFESTGIGIGVDVLGERFDSGALELDGIGTRTGIALSVFRETSRRGLALTLGHVDTGDDDVLWGRARYAHRDRDGRRESTLELALRESVEGAPELRLGATRDRVGVSTVSALGVRGFARLSAEANETTTRVTEQRVARGLAARAELGLRGASGALAWSGSVAAAAADNRRADTLPEELRLVRSATFDDVLARRTRTLSLNGSLSRGGVGDAFPRLPSPRWFVNGGLSRTMPDGALGLQVDAGAGFRVLGNDELGFAFARDARLSGARVEPDSTTFGIEYRHRF